MKMKRIFVPTQNPSEWQRLLGKPEHWKKGYSAMATAASWEEAKGEMPKEIVDYLKESGQEALNELKLLAALPEWKVSFKPEGGRPSQTDVLALASNEKGLVVIAVESKVDESFGDKDEKDLNEERKKDLLDVMGLRDYIKPYQLLHRTASAIKTARDFHARTALMLVHSFSGSKTGANYDTFNLFCVELGAKKVAEDLYNVSRFDSPCLYLGWCQGDHASLNIDYKQIYHA